MKTDAIEIFQTIRASMQPFETLGFNARINSEKEYDLWSEKNIIVDGKKSTETHFAGIKVFKDHVSLYFMPVEDDDEIAAVFHPDLLMLLKDKTHFNIKALDEKLMEQIAEALDRGYKIFKQNEWV
ncbi:MAG: hypothetical protein EOO07_13520 [Chitinophagaceae bacterium]|nr:MAG: hypothetical protein EOO07_13520 [Chitinophagaceae bacterium]